MDHIVPRAAGGNNTRANLVAVCRDCNAAKGKLPFAVFEKRGIRPQVTMNGTLDRVNEMQAGNLDFKVFRKLKAEIKRRLRQTELDDPIDERQLGSTAYAAVDIRERVAGTYFDGDLSKVAVYPGRITQAARRASGIDKQISLREGLDSKSRFDRRHHAIDAVIAAMLNNSVARTLSQRSEMLDGAYMSNNHELKEQAKSFEGDSPAAIAKYRKWKTDMARVADLLRAEVTEDRLVVTQPVRFSGRHSALHEDGRAPHARKLVGDKWTPAERARIVDRKVYERLSQGLLPSEELPWDPARKLRLPNGKLLDSQGVIYIFPDTASRIGLPNNSSSKLGSTLHHIRLYRWKDAKGKRQAGVVRIFANDLQDLGANILGSNLEESMRAVRYSDVKLRDAIASGIAEHVGTILPGDELIIEPKEWSPSDSFGRFLSAWPEKNWSITGWESNRLFNLKPRVLSKEGAQVAGSDTPDSKKVQLDEEHFQIIDRSARPSASNLWTKPGTQIIRRNSLGRIRQSTVSGMPISWSPYQVVNGD
jgi:CRISPR-associated endonuclease Csn1